MCMCMCVSSVFPYHGTEPSVQVYSSEEGRVQTTAAAFAKGLLALDGEVPAILVSLVRKGPVVNDWLDDCSKAKAELKKVKEKLHRMVIEDKDVSELPDLNPENVHSVAAALQRIGNPRAALYRLKNLMVTLDREIGELPPSTQLYDKELLQQMHERWTKGLTEFYDPDTDTFNVSKIPDVFDLARYDYCHNPLEAIQTTLTATFVQARDLAHVVVPQGWTFSIPTLLCPCFFRGIGSFRASVHRPQIHCDFPIMEMPLSI
eukprot:m.1374288 g.1374288  ORF g.1374288 m.1374288 type:complete len:261 (+) comp24959_c0_seq4:3-785(+)